MLANFPNKLNLDKKTIREIGRCIEPHLILGMRGDKIPCVEWKGPHDNYEQPIFKLKGVYRLTKEIIYESWYGKVDQEMTVVNTCKNKNCIRPEHLELKYIFYPETYARNGQKDPKNKRKRRLVKVTEKKMERLFRGIDKGLYKSISEIGKFLNVDNNDAIEFLHNDIWIYINDIYSKEELDELRAKVMQNEKPYTFSVESFIENLLKNDDPFES